MIVVAIILAVLLLGAVLWMPIPPSNAEELRMLRDYFKRRDRGDPW